MLPPRLRECIAKLAGSSVIIERFSIVEIAVCEDGDEDSRFLASLGMTNWLELGTNS
jgi:hypothetical protein